jgi:23S rRNA U2552 (ribose-2'-O)-methylase RlmE/FtsJ
MTQDLQVFKIPNVDNDIFKNDNDKFESDYQSKPLFSLGFHSFIHRTKSKMDKTNKLEIKSKFYLVVNPFEHKVSNYDNSISDVTKEYLNLKDTNILTRAFYKMWEILMLFDIADSKKLTYGALAEGPGSFLQAVYYYRQKIQGNDLKNDKYHGITLHSESGSVPDMSSDFKKFLDKKNPGLFNLHSTVSKKDITKDKDNGDLTQLNTINNFAKGKLCDLVTADGGFNWKDENYQEQEAYQLIMGEILTAIKIQNKGGHFVLKVFDIFTPITTKLLSILTDFYEEIYIHKPYMSRSSNSEKYIICKRFKFSRDKDLESKIKYLETMLENLQSTIYVNNLVSNYKLDDDLKSTIRFMNIKLVNVQQMQINKIIEYID